MSRPLEAAPSGSDYADIKAPTSPEVCATRCPVSRSLGLSRCNWCLWGSG